MAAFKFGKKPLVPAPVESAAILPDSKATEELVATQIRMNEANNNDVDALVNQPRS